MANFDEIQNPEAKDRLHNMQTVIEQLETEESPKAKQIRKLLENETDQDFREILEDKLQSLESNGSVDLDEAIDKVRNLGYEPVDVLQAGLMKKRDSYKASQKAKETREASE